MFKINIFVEIRKQKKKKKRRRRMILVQMNHFKCLIALSQNTKFFLFFFKILILFNTESKVIK
jgi:hypothetical protein